MEILMGFVIVVGLLLIGFMIYQIITGNCSLLDTPEDESFRCAAERRVEQKPFEGEDKRGSRNS